MHSALSELVSNKFSGCFGTKNSARQMYARQNKLMASRIALEEFIRGLVVIMTTFIKRNIFGLRNRKLKRNLHCGQDRCLKLFIADSAPFGIFCMQFQFITTLRTQEVMRSVMNPTVGNSCNYFIRFY